MDHIWLVSFHRRICSRVGGFQAPAVGDGLVGKDEILVMSKWPKDNQAALIKFYGDPGTGEVANHLVKITPPFKMYYDGKLLKTISFHEKAAPALTAALYKCWDFYGNDQSVIDKLGISKTAGTYNPRKIRGSATKWSNHAYGAAIDINAEQNGFNVAGNIPLPMIAAFKSEGFRWGGDYKGRKDPMHFEACDSGEPDRSFDGWLKALGVKEKPANAPEHVEDFATDAPDTNPAPEAAPAAVSKPPSIIDNLVPLARSIAGAGAVGATAGQVASTIADSPSDVAEKVTQVTDKSGAVIAATKQVIAVPKPGFWNGLLSVVSSPGFLVSMIVLMAAMWFVVWFIQRQHQQQTAKP